MGPRKDIADGRPREDVTMWPERGIVVEELPIRNHDGVKFWMEIHIVEATDAVIAMKPRKYPRSRSRGRMGDI